MIHDQEQHDGSAAGSGVAARPALRESGARRAGHGLSAWTDVLLAAGLALLAVLAHARSLQVPFVYDDLRTIVNNPTLRPGASLGAVVAFERFRPLVTLSYKLDATLWGLKAVGFHVTALALHALAVVLLLRVAARLPGSSRATAALAAALFAVHPAFVQGVGYVNGRAELLCAVAMLAALLAHARLVETGRVIFGAFVLALWVVALACKESGAALPAVLLLIERARPADAGRWRRVALLELPMLAAAGLGGAARAAAYFSGEHGDLFLSGGEHLSSMPLTVLRYVGLLVVPAGQTVMHVGPAGGLSLKVVLATLTLIALGAWIWRGLARGSLVALGAAWFLVVLAPCVIIPLKDRVAEQRLYLAGAGAMVAAAAFLRATLEARYGHRGALGAAALLLVLAGASAARYSVWVDPEALWTEALTREPTAGLAWNNRGVVRYERGRLDEAAADFERAIALEPRDLDALANRAAVRLDQGDVTRARADLDLALTMNPHHLTSLITRSAVRDRQGDYLGAIADCDAALAINPMLVRPIMNRATALAHLDRRREALGEYSRAIVLEPGFAEARVNRALTRVSLGDLEGALDDAQQAVALAPRLVIAHCTLGRVQALRGELDATRAAFDRALELRPGDGGILHLLGVALTLGGDQAGAIDAFRRSASAMPRHAPTWFNLGVLLARTGDVDGALACYARVLTLDPRNSSAYRGRAELLLARGNPASALAELEAALHVDPEDPRTLKARGDLRSTLGNTAGAADDYERALLTCRVRAPELEAPLLQLLGRPRKK